MYCRRIAYHNIHPRCRFQVSVLYDYYSLRRSVIVLSEPKWGRRQWKKTEIGSKNAMQPNTLNWLQFLPFVFSLACRLSDMQYIDTTPEATLRKIWCVPCVCVCVARSDAVSRNTYERTNDSCYNIELITCSYCNGTQSDIDTRSILFMVYSTPPSLPLNIISHNMGKIMSHYLLFLVSRVYFLRHFPECSFPLALNTVALYICIQYSWYSSVHGTYSYITGWLLDVQCKMRHTCSFSICIRTNFHMCVFVCATTTLKRHRNKHSAVC